MKNGTVEVYDRAYRTMIRDWVLRDLMFGGGRDTSELQEMLAHAGVNPHYAFPAVALFDPGAGKQDDNRRAVKLRETLEGRAPDGAEVFANGAGQIGLLFSRSASDELESLRRESEAALRGPVSVGVGNSCSRLTDIRLSYEQAQAALRHKFYRGTNRVIRYAQVPPSHALREYPLKRELELARRIPKLEDEEAIARDVSGFYRELLQDGPIEIDHIYELTIRLLAGVENRLTPDEQEDGGRIRHEIVPILRMETLEEIERFVSGYFADLREEFHRREREKDVRRSVIQQTIVYMEAECRHATLDSVARRVYMTPTYLSMLFRANTGRTFIEQLTDIRINKAKEMLRSTCLKNYEVAEKVGYRDSRYFSQIFKKKVGLSPSEYRESVTG
ncbi:helix-turn-helix domain-containing protein [Cohnella cellulosilytica]|uniref:Helix-turn-helix domain-containing protein n=1 Tax=Cohnella cellulosilytica TaxID=986710 RepID=A0ABW2FCQ7_9BACL